MPDKRIWRYQLTLIVVLVTTLSTLFLIFWLPPVIRDNGGTTTFGENSFQEDVGMARTNDLVFDFLPNAINTFFFIISLFLLSELLFFWVPSLTDLSEKKGNGKMVWLRKHGVIPERVFSLKNSNAQILIHRKRSSLRGLLMKEFTMEIYIDKNIPEIKQISDFTSIEKMVQTPSHKILVKTIKLKSLPLQLIQIRTILALMMKSPEKTLSDIRKLSSPN